MQADRPTVPEVLDRFQAYHVKHAAWGSLHVVLDEGCYRDDLVRSCIKWARKTGDAEGEALAEILLRMSKTQRGKIGNLA